MKEIFLTSCLKDDIKQAKSFKKNDFVYFDPPYLITEAEYNLIWTQEHDNELMKLCNFLNKKI